MRKNQLLLDSGSDLHSIKGVITFINRYTQQADVKLEDDTILKKLNFFYHCIPSNLDDADLAFLVGDTVYLAKEGTTYIIIGFGSRRPRSCLLKRFFARVKKMYWDDYLEMWMPAYYYYWICFDAEGNIVIFEVRNDEGRTEEEIEADQGMHDTLDMNLTLFTLLDQSATKAFLMVNDYNYNERWVATSRYLFKEKRIFTDIEPKWTVPPPCDEEEIPCPPNRFYCDTTKNILVWYGSHEVFVGALIIRMNAIIPDGNTDYTWNSVAASGIQIEDPGGLGTYRTLADTEWDIPLNMLSGVKEVNDTEITFYLPYGNNWRPGTVTIDWINYEWGYKITSEITDCAKHWYWAESGFEEKNCVSLDQTDLDESIVDKDEDYFDNACPCSSITTQEECEACNEIMQDAGKYKRTVNQCTGYISLYNIKIFDELFEADTTYRNLGIWEGKIYTAHHCIWDEGAGNCYTHGVVGYNAARRTVGEQLEQKHTNGLSAFWNSNNVAYFFKEQNRHKCVGSANQIGKICTGSFGSTNCVRWGGPTQAEFCKCCWVCDWPAYLCAEDCPEGLGKCFELDMPGDDWLDIENDYVEVIVVGVSYKWHRNSNNDSYAEPLVRKFKVDEEIEFDATKIYKTYYLDDRSTTYGVIGKPNCESLGLLVAGKGLDQGDIFWEIYYDGEDITNELITKLGCDPDELDELGLI